MGKKNYFIAFLDILGFRRFAQKHTLEEMYSRIQDMFAAARASEVWGTVNINDISDSRILSKLPYIAISDSIIIYQEVIPLKDIKNKKKWKEEAFREFLIGLEELFKEAFKRKIFLRGGISYGEAIISLDDDNREYLVIGNSYIQAVDIEKVQSWMGVAFHPSMNEFLDNSQYRDLLVEYEIPVKDSYQSCELPNLTLGWVDATIALEEKIFDQWEIDNNRQQEIKSNTKEFFERYVDRPSRCLGINVSMNSIRHP